ncbi:zinc c6 finger domain protein [Ophiostoma piceae UAMH 11346]|uniref:Zinc c6 finger domain protein n=1 Tax=Ophiostoma piceae (strain UAMH 11346) TaxID=1262450 RepID=S3CE62_OPHP1|nr:zinc c6 finger domain protein [Ophiostoma piceae UAMH 11346]
MQQRSHSDWLQGTPRILTRTSSRPARSREGCLTCKRRKVKCDEQRARCSHCERLNLECKWRPPSGSQEGNTGESTSMALKQLQLPLAQPARLQGRSLTPAAHTQPQTLQGQQVQHAQHTQHSRQGQQNSQIHIQTPAPTQTPVQAHAQPHAVAQTPGTVGPSLNAVNQIFDFASFMWDAEDVWQETGPDAGLGVIGVGSCVPTAMQNTGAQVLGFGDTQMQDNAHGQRHVQTQQFQAPQQNNQPHQHHTHNQSSISEPSTVPDSTGMADGDPSSQAQGLGQVPAENYRLMDYFTHAVIPPILAEVETQNKWLVMRRVLVGRANASRMVRWAILAFSNVILTQREGAWLESQHNHYENALAEVVAMMGEISPVYGNTATGSGLPLHEATDGHIKSRATLPTATSPEAGVITDGSGVNGHGSSSRGNPSHHNSNDIINTNTNGNDNETINDHTHSIAAANNTPTISLTHPSVQRENLLATLFFLSYVDILRGRIEAAHSNLKRAHRILQLNSSSNTVTRPGKAIADKSSEKPARFSTVEHQFLLWLRLLDARAVSAGGEGLFLSHDDEVMLVETPPPPGGLGLEGPEGIDESSSRARGASDDDDIEDVLFQILYRPGIVFFQKVQSFMGRISRIDPWHRSRGTVEDEIEVMNIGASIASDLRALYESRPSLMDYAASGRLTAAHVSAHLAMAITRSFRTYLCNYYASKVHLHRVAYKSLPLTAEATDALAQIRRLARLLVEGLDTGLDAAGADHEALPVNMLWPLLMLGSEETDADERLWIHTQILRMQAVAGNSRITAQVLEEVQARQDATKTRVDIRSVMHDIFNSCFAIV